jgi:hypothetical protein
LRRSRWRRGKTIRSGTDGLFRPNMPPRMVSSTVVEVVDRGTFDFREATARGLICPGPLFRVRSVAGGSMSAPCSQEAGAQDAAAPVATAAGRGRAPVSRPALHEQCGVDDFPNVGGWRGIQCCVLLFRRSVTHRFSQFVKCQNSTGNAQARKCYVS